MRARQAIEDYLLAGGEIKRFPELATSIDWSHDTAFRAAARAVSARGHEARRKRRG